MSTIISLVAAPGAGKTTQTELFVAENPNTIVLRASAVLAEYMSHIRAGQLVDDSIVNRKMCLHVLEALAKNPDFLILDGYPRTLCQLEYAHGLAVSLGAFHIVTRISLPLETALARLERRKESGLRPDDSPAVVTKRFRQFEEKTRWLLGWLESDANRYVPFLQVDGSGTEEEVFAQFSAGVQCFVRNRMPRQAVSV